MEFQFKVGQTVIVSYNDLKYIGVIVDAELYDDEPDYLVRSDDSDFDGCGWFRTEKIAGVGA